MNALNHISSLKFDQTNPFPSEGCLNTLEPQVEQECTPVKGVKLKHTEGQKLGLGPSLRPGQILHFRFFYTKVTHFTIIRITFPQHLLITNW